jgi:hypothetical protein
MHACIPLDVIYIAKCKHLHKICTFHYIFSSNFIIMNSPGWERNIYTIQQVTDIYQKIIRKIWLNANPRNYTFLKSSWQTCILQPFHKETWNYLGCLCCCDILFLFQIIFKSSSMITYSFIILLLFFLIHILIYFKKIG